MMIIEDRLPQKFPEKLSVTELADLTPLLTLQHRIELLRLFFISTIYHLTAIMANPHHDVGSGESDSSDPLENFLEQQCGWCKRTKPMKSGSKFCSDCYDSSYRVCSRCKIPYPDAKYFNESPSTRCNSCHKKYLKDRETREKKRLQQLHQQQQQHQQPKASTSTSTSSSRDKPKEAKKRKEKQKESQIDVPFSSSSSSSSSCSADEDDANYSVKHKVIILQSLLLDALKSEIARRKKRNDGKKKLKNKKQ